MSTPTAASQPDAVLRTLSGGSPSYQTQPRQVSSLARLFPSACFYRKLAGIVWRSGQLARRGQYGDLEWYLSSVEVLQALEEVGVRVEITGLDHLSGLTPPCVIVGNHMSVLETFVLPGVIRPFFPVTFIVKQSLLDYPVFRHVMRSRDPVAVTRVNPRKDLQAVLKGGKDRLQQGISIIVFPQTTRTCVFDPKEFNSIGIKLAQRANVPVVPLALRTDAWNHGRLLRDVGKIDPTRKVHLAFGEPLTVGGRGKFEHDRVLQFIQNNLARWRA